MTIQIKTGIFWVKEFERTAVAFGLTKPRMAAVLHLYLEDKALMDYDDMMEHTGNVTWEQIKEALGNNFQYRKGNFRNVVAMLNKHGKIKPGQSISSYYSDLVSIINRKQRTISPEERETVLKSAFLMGLTNETILDEISKSESDSLKDILAVARSWETIHNEKIAANQEDDKVLGVDVKRLEEDAFDRAVKVSARLNAGQKQTAARPIRQTKRVVPPNHMCYRCRQYGHESRECRSLTHDQGRSNTYRRKGVRSFNTSDRGSFGKKGSVSSNRSNYNRHVSYSNGIDLMRGRLQGKSEYRRNIPSQDSDTRQAGGRQQERML